VCRQAFTYRSDHDKAAHATSSTLLAIGDDIRRLKHFIIDHDGGLAPGVARVQEQYRLIPIDYTGYPHAFTYHLNSISRTLLRAIAHAIRMGYCFIHNLSTHNTLYPCLLPCYTRLIWQWLKRMELVMDLDADDLREIIQQNRKLLQTHKRHKRVIEGQIAGFGKLHAPSHLLLQESDLDEQIQECESNIEAV